GAISSPKGPNAQSRSSYLHPLYGLDGEVLTDDFPKDHDYHRGLYWAWPHIKMGEQEYDLWSLRGIRSGFRRSLPEETKSGRAVVSAENVWVAGGKELLLETMRIEVHPASAQSRALD